MNLSLDQLAPHLGLPRDLLEAANRANLTPSSILLTPIPRISDILRIKVPLAQQLVSRVARAVAPGTSRLNEVYDLERGVGPSTTAGTGAGDGKGTGGAAGSNAEEGGEGSNGHYDREEIVTPKGEGKGKGKERGKWISTGDEGMDKTLGGGLRRGCLYEITGESAAGKSHLALTLALSAQLPSLTSSPGASLILTSERELSTSRLIQLSKSLLATHEHTSPSSIGRNDTALGEDSEVEWEQGQGRVRSLLDNVLTNRVGDVDALEHAFNYAVPAILETRLKVHNQNNQRKGNSNNGSRIRSNGSNVTSSSSKFRIGSNGSETTDNIAAGPATEVGPHESIAAGAGRMTSNGSSTSSLSNNSSARSGYSNVLPIRLIVLDSITALFRGGTSSNDERPTGPSSLSLTERSKHLCIVADALKSLASTYDLAIVVINQVSDVFNRAPHPMIHSGTPPTSSFTQTQAFLGGKIDENPPMLYASQAKWFSGQSNTLGKEASLGIVWANAINVRIMLSRTGRRRLLHQSDLRPSKRRQRPGAQDQSVVNDSENGNDNVDSSTLTLTQQGLGVEVDDVKPTLIRRMHVVFSPFSAASTVDYVITPSGVHTLPESYKLIDVTETARKKQRQEDKDRENGTGLHVSRNIGIGIGIGSQVASGERDGDGDGLEEGGADEWDVFDDFGELPDEFWQGKYGLDDQGRVVVPPVDDIDDGRGDGNNDGDGGGDDEGVGGCDEAGAGDGAGDVAGEKQAPKAQYEV
ncbi:hypothetical protein IAT40_001164 [Kwoniella sp. CBS 6097]